MSSLLSLLTALRYFALLPFVLHAMAFLSPHANLELAHVIAWTAASEAPLYQVDASGERTAAALVATARDESSFRLSALGDGGKSYGPFQIFGRNLSIDAGAREALRQLRVSLAMCGDFTAYLAGRCDVPRAQTLAHHRENTMLRIYTEVSR